MSKCMSKCTKNVVFIYFTSLIIKQIIMKYKQIETRFMVHYLIIIYNIFNLLILQLSLVSFFNAYVFELYIVCSQPVKAIQNNFLYSHSRAVKFRPN